MTTYFRVVWPIILPSIIQPPLDLSLALTTLIGLSHFLRHGVSLRNIMKGEESLLNSNSLEYTPLQPSYMGIPIHYGIHYMFDTKDIPIY